MTLMKAILVVLISLSAGLTGTVHAGSASFSRGLSSTAVPAVQGLTIEGAYKRLHQAGLRVSYARRLTLPADATAEVSRQTPHAGAHARRGAVVTLDLSVPPTGTGSPAVPNEIPSATVPNFKGKTLTTVQEWAKTNGLRWEATHLPGLTAGTASQLLGNYLVSDQTPATGTRLSLGHQGPSGAFTPTPLVVHATQR
jgi:beta-lactam-binding protein with PASTA domain